MKKITLWLFALFTCWQINAQVSSYSFSAGTTGTLDPMTGSTQLVASGSDDGVSAVTNIGFTFNYAGVSYTQFSANANGLVRLGGTVVTGQWTNSAANANTASPAIMPYWDDLATGSAAGGGKVHYLLTGSAPNQKLIIEWFVTVPRATGGAANARFQCVLNEGSNVIEFIYGAGMVVNTANSGATVGLATATTAYNTVDVVTNTNSTSTFTTTNTAAIASGTIYTWTPPSCVAPSGFVSSAITTNSATIAWNAASPVPSTGYEYYYSDVNTAPTGAGTPINALTANLAGLNAATTYYVWLRSDCGGTFSAWNGPFTFTTLCVSVTDFVQDFEATTGAAFPVCWAKVGATGTANTQASTGISGARNLYMYSSAVASRPVVSMTPVSNANAGTHRMRMKVRGNFSAGETIEFGYLTNPSDATTFTPISSIVTNSATVAQDFVIVPTGMPAGDVVFALRTGTALLSVLIDDVNWEPIPAVAPTCSTITSPTTGAINVANSVVTWTSSTDATGYYINAGFSGPGSTDVLNLEDVGNVLSYAIPTDPGTTYHVTVIPYNAFGQATGCTESNFTTCDEVGDFVENFDGLAATGLIPGCWSRVLSDGVSTFASVGSDTDNFTAPYSIELYNSNSPATSNIMLVTPFINNLSAGTNRLRFVARNSTDSEDVIVGTMSNPSDASTFTPLETVDINGTFAQYIVDFTGYTGTDDYIAIKRLSTSTYTYVYIDNFVWEALPLTAPICATNVIATPNATCGNFANSITWNVTSGADGYYVTVGTTTGGNDIANAVSVSGTSYNFTGNFNTTYFYTIVPYNANGSATGCTEQSFTTNVNGCYCVSAPTSVDGLGITNVQIVSTNFANTVSTSPVYNDHTATPVTMSQGINNNVQISFDTGFGYDYNIVIWIDANDDFNLDDSEIVYTGLAPNTPIVTHNASFVMPGTMPLGQHRMRIVVTDALQTPFNPCYSGAYGETADFTVNIVAASCTPPAATTAVVPACGSGIFFVVVTVTALGSGTPSISDGTTTWPVTAIGVVNVGPFADASSVTLTLLHGSEATCNLPLGSFTYTCPAVNDDLCNAIPITVNATSTGTAYGNVGATAQANEPVPGCFSDNINGSVWFSFVAPASGEVIITTDIAGATATDTEIAVYAATGVTCSDMTTLGAALGCDQDSGTTINYNSVLNLPGLTAGNTYYIQVDDYGFGTSQGSFGLQVTEVLSSDNFDANNFVAYPNPVKDIFNISYSSEISSVRIINLLGQEVITREVNATSTQIDMSQLSSGAYIVNVTVGDTIKTIKVVKQ